MNNHVALMRRAIAMADTARIIARPNPWVGAVLCCADGSFFDGATEAPGGAHAEVVAIRAAHNAGVSTTGATLYCTLEPCSHTGRTGPCTTAIIDAGITTVIAGITDPDEKVSGTGFDILRRAGVNVEVDVCADEIALQLAPYIHHRRTKRPFVVLKMATTLDGRTFLSNGPRWLTGDTARTRVHQLRAESDAIVVGMGTVRIDDPELTVRHVNGPSPRRLVMSRHGDVPASAKVNPCTVWRDGLEELLDELGKEGVLQVLVEGGPTVATAFHEAGLIDSYIFHIAPLVSGDEHALGIFNGDAATLRHLNIVSVAQLGDDVEIVMEPLKMKVEAP